MHIVIYHHSKKDGGMSILPRSLMILCERIFNTKATRSLTVRTPQHTFWWVILNAR